jgi:peptidoglycan/LPS O-acetylase OafA/YrhL
LHHPRNILIVVCVGQRGVFTHLNVYLDVESCGIEARVQTQVNSSDQRAAVPPPQPLISSIQALRALAAWGVVLHHYCLIFTVANPGWLRRALIGHGAAGVDVFFVVSGLVMGLNASDPAVTPRGFIAKRLSRIVPAYWLYTLVIAFLIVRVPEMMPKQGYSPGFLVRSLLFIPTVNPSGIGLYPINTVGWSLNVEMAFYVVVALSLFAPRPQRGLWIAGGVVLLQRLVSSLGVGSSLYGDPMIYEFMMGIAAAHLWQAGALRGRSWWFGCLAAFAIACFSRSPSGSGWGRTVDDGVPAFLLVCAVLGLERYFARANLLVHFGNHSYSVYLIHPTVLYAGWYVHRTTQCNVAVLSVGCLAAIAALGGASYRFLERPAGRLLTRLLLPRNPTSSSAP